MPASRQLLWWALLTCCRGAASAVDDDAFAPIPDQGEEIFARDSGFRDFDRPEPILMRAKEISSPGSGFGDPDASAPVQDQAKKISSPGSGFGDPDASAPVQDQTKKISSPGSGFGDPDASAPVQDQSKKISAPDSGFAGREASAPIQDRATDSGFSYLKRKRYQALKEKLRKIPLPNEKLLPHLTDKFVTLLNPRKDYPERLREVHIGGDKDLMNGVKLYRSARPKHKPQTSSEHADTMPLENLQTPSGQGGTMPSDNPQTRPGNTNAMPSDNPQTHRGSTDVTSSDNSQTHRGNTDAMPSVNPQTHSGSADTTSSADSDAYDGVLRIVDVSFLQELNVKNIINLNPWEFSPDSELLLQNAGIHVDYIPIMDWKTPTSEQISDAIKSIENTRRSGASSWIFCGYGDGRSGTIVAAYEIWKIVQAYPDLSPTDLQTYVMRRNGYIKIAHGMFSEPQANELVNRYNTHKLETTAQVDALLAFANQISTQTECVDI